MDVIMAGSEVLNRLGSQYAIRPRVLAQPHVSPVVGPAIKLANLAVPGP
jgi:hypothetical protein